MQHKTSKLNLFNRSSLGSSVRSSVSDGLMSKVPHQMRQSLQEHKQKKKKSLKFTTLYRQFKNVISLQKQCAICMMKITNPCSLSDCLHIFCEQCLLNYLTFKINSMEEILCPEEGCDKKLDINSQAFKNLPETYKAKYKKQQLWYQTMKNPDLKLCPIQTCNQGTINMRTVPPQCQKCQTVFCQECMMKQHAGRQCDQNFKLNFKQWKRCPKCEMFIEKTEGCNHMVCRCQNQFCFVCLQPWHNDHYACVQNAHMNFFQTEEIRFPKLIAIGLILIMPFLFIAANLALILGAVLSFVIGFFAGLIACFQILGDCCCVAIILLPLAVVIGAIAGFVWGTFFYILPIINQYIDRYIRTIGSLCRNN